MVLQFVRDTEMKALLSKAFFIYSKKEYDLRSLAKVSRPFNKGAGVGARAGRERERERETETETETARERETETERESREREWERERKGKEKRKQKGKGKEKRKQKPKRGLQFFPVVIALAHCVIGKLTNCVFHPSSVIRNS